METSYKIAVERGHLHQFGSSIKLARKIRKNIKRRFTFLELSAKLFAIVFLDYFSKS
jgi:hypothetical protein